MKRLTAIGIVIALLMLPVLACAEGTPFGGTKVQPTFHGFQLGLGMPYVLLWEDYYNGCDPELIAPDVDSLEELDESDAFVVYSIGEEEVCGAACEVRYQFYYNMFTEACLSANFQEEADARAWCEAISEAFTALYGEGHDIILNTPEFSEGEGETDIFNVSWQERRTQTPFSFVAEFDNGRTANCLPRQYVLPDHSIRASEGEDGVITATATIALSYYYYSEDAYFELCGPDITKAIKGIRAEEYTAKYHDGRYYPRKGK